MERFTRKRMRSVARLVGIASVLVFCGVASAWAVPVTVASNPLWTDTGIDLNGNAFFIHDATGSWTWGSAPLFDAAGDYQPSLAYDEWISNNQHGELIGFVGDDPYSLDQNDARLFAIGTAFYFNEGVYGRLWLGFNDDWASGAIGDNYGSVVAQVDVAPVPEPGTMLLLGSGLLGLAGLRRKMKK